MPKTSQAAVQLGPDRIEIQEIPIPEIKPDEGLLRVERCGLCGSDVEQYKGERKDRKYPVIPGTSLSASSNGSAIVRHATGACKKVIESSSRHPFRASTAGAAWKASSRHA